MESYEEILQRMEDAYEQESGHRAEDVSDTGLRLKVLAGELYRLRAQIAWLERQAFPQTASGEWLDRHGAQRGVIRREAAKAKGVITFSRYLPLSFDLLIPKGAVCAVPGDEPVEYVTTQEAVLPEGALSVDVPAQAAAGGASGNAAAGYINAMVMPVNGINYVTNKQAFTGGRERESEEAFRARVLDAYRNLPSGSNAAYYRDVALSLEGVGAAGAKPRINGANTVGVYVWGVDGPPEEALLERLRQEYELRRELGVTVTVQAAQAQAVNVNARLRFPPEVDSVRALEEAEAAVREYLNSRALGDPVYVADLQRVILEAAPAVGLEFSSSVRDVEGDPGRIPTAGTVSLEAAL